MSTDTAPAVQGQPAVGPRIRGWRRWRLTAPARLYLYVVAGAADVAGVFLAGLGGFVFVGLGGLLIGVGLVVGTEAAHRSTYTPFAMVAKLREAEQSWRARYLGRAIDL
jgi:hypothetical protein